MLEMIKQEGGNPNQKPTHCDRLQFEYHDAKSRRILDSRLRGNDEKCNYKVDIITDLVICQEV
jgi:hypothetical protein